MSRLVSLLLAALLSAGCAGTRDWWQRDLQAWQGAPVSELLDVWGPPLRTLTGENEATVLVYESARQLDHRLEELKDPATRLDPDTGGAQFARVERGECTLYFEILAERVMAARHEGSACEIRPRRGNPPGLSNP
ncbi:MAG: hypothetical protein ACNA8G_01805 [Gammaproteobacteria bacterium]